MIELNTDFVLQEIEGGWVIEQFYYIHAGGPEYDPQTDRVHYTEPECGFRPIHQFEAQDQAEASRIAREWLNAIREQIISTIFLNEHPDGGWFTGGWNRQAGQWLRPLDPETRRATGCHSEFSHRPFSALTYDQALQDAYNRYGEEAIDRQLVRRISTNEAAEIYNVPPSSITLACRNGDIAHAQKRGRDWSFPTVTFLLWINNRPGRGRK